MGRGNRSERTEFRSPEPRVIEDAYSMAKEAERIVNESR